MFDDNVLVMAVNNARKHYFPVVDKKDMWVPHDSTHTERLGSASSWYLRGPFSGGGGGIG
jgi:hypothetical protein